MTDFLFFDTDVLLSFLFVERETILSQLYGGRIILPKQVYAEIKPKSPERQKVDNLIKFGRIRVEALEDDSDEIELYMELTTQKAPIKRIGEGEAAAIVMAKCRGGVLVSSNLNDVVVYANLYNLRHMATGNVFIDAIKSNIITKGQADAIWINMVKRNRKLPTQTFLEYLAQNNILLP
jgi:predicted nucleic acid-binding protein